MDNEDLERFTEFYGKPYIKQSFKEIICAVAGSDDFDNKTPMERQNMLKFIFKLKELVKLTQT